MREESLAEVARLERQGRCQRQARVPRGMRRVHGRRHCRAAGVAAAAGRADVMSNRRWHFELYPAPSAPAATARCTCCLPAEAADEHLAVLPGHPEGVLSVACAGVHPARGCGEGRLVRPVQSALSCATLCLWSACRKQKSCLGEVGVTSCGPLSQKCTRPAGGARETPASGGAAQQGRNGRRQAALRLPKMR